MKTSGMFDTAAYTIKFKSSKDQHYLVPFSDVHWGHTQFAKKDWAKFCKWGKDNPNAHFIGNGDYWDFSNARGRAAIKAHMNEEQRDFLDEVMQEQVDEFAEQIEFMRGRLVGLGDGNHDWEFQDGTNATMRLAKKLGVPYLGVSAVVLFQLEHHNRRCNFQYYQHHGKGGNTSTAGGSYNAVERMHKHVEGVRIFVMGHNHDMGICPGKPRLYYDWNDKQQKLVPKSIRPFYCRSGGFTKAYDPGKKSYVVDAAMGPTAIGTPYFMLGVPHSGNASYQPIISAVTPE